ncbi:MAG: HAMP domain-containing histidine kinase [Candidatus Cloacimonetes bacterium]|nr:HAMP domain-containing histidine kinase [Candidatus Cloacimonadota bacterium]
MKQKRKNSNQRRFIQLYYIGGSLLIFFMFIFYTNSLLKQVKKDVEVVPDLYSKFLGLPDDVNLEQFIFSYFMQNIVPKINYPIIIADSLRTPSSWEYCEIEKKSYDELTFEDQQKLQKMYKNMEAKGNYIVLKPNIDSKEVVGYLFYGESDTMKRLRIMPYLEMLIVIIFILLGVYGLSILKKNDRNMLWVGLAKETAHQFGTPLSSLKAWNQFLAMRIKDKYDDEEMLAMLEDMNTDIDRLHKVASRFGKVGSTIKLKPINLDEIISETIDYFQKRLPNYSKKIEIKYISKIDDLEIIADSDLIKWTLENLIRNSIDALTNTAGEILITSFIHKKRIHVQISDTGKGLPKKMFKSIFFPGVTTKERGWGLGLSLAKRIIEKYHNGIIKVLESEINKGTTIEIVLPRKSK